MKSGASVGAPKNGRRRGGSIAQVQRVWCSGPPKRRYLARGTGESVVALCLWPFASHRQRWQRMNSRLIWLPCLGSFGLPSSFSFPHLFLVGDISLLPVGMRCAKILLDGSLQSNLPFALAIKLGLYNSFTFSQKITQFLIAARLLLQMAHRQCRLQFVRIPNQMPHAQRRYSLFPFGPLRHPQNGRLPRGCPATAPGPQRGQSAAALCIAVTYSHISSRYSAYTTL